MRRTLAVLLTATMVVFALTGCRDREQARTQPAGASRDEASERDTDTSRLEPRSTEPPAPKPPTRPAPSAHKAIDAEHLARARADVAEGIAFLLTQRNDDGGWGFAPGVSHPALTAMVLKALVQHEVSLPTGQAGKRGGRRLGPHPDYTSESPVVAKGFECLMKFRQPDGGFYNPQEGNANYVTSVAVMALAAAKNRKHREVLAGAVKFLRSQQIVPGSTTSPAAGEPAEKVGEKHPYVGGVSYGKHGRPDLSNLGFWMSAMHEAGVPGDDPAMQRALAFVQRLQNRTEGTEGQAFVVGGNDGGFIYAVRRRGSTFVPESKADERTGRRSYGSMTYTGFKSMLYANVAKTDPRVRAAYEWIRKHWRLDSNPNMPQRQSKQGLFYYYHVFAKALRAWGEDVITDPRGVRHNWREELIDVLASQQGPDGSWTNVEDRWMERNPVLVTCYSVLALQEALKQ